MVVVVVVAILAVAEVVRVQRLSVYTENEQCLRGDVLRQRLHRVCNASLVNSSADLQLVDRCRYDTS